MPNKTVDRQHPESDLAVLWELAKAPPLKEYEEFKDSPDRIIQAAIAKGHYTETKYDVGLLHSIIRGLGHTIVDGEWYRNYPWIGSPPPVSMKRLLKVITRAAIHKKERKLLRERLKSECDDEYDIDKIPRLPY